MNQQTLTPPRTIPLPPWLPPHRRARLAGQPVDLRLPRAVLARLRSPEKIGGADWAANYRTVGDDSAHPGPWRHEYAPHTVKIANTFTQPWVREVWFCGVDQSGKTNTMLNCMGWCIDCDPGNIFYLMPTEDTSNKVTSKKIKPLLTLSPRLARYLSRRQDDTTLSGIRLNHGVTIWPAHANSASSMATWTAKHCFGDELDKYPAMVGKEADPVTLLKKRNRTYPGRYKRFFVSTPGEARLIVKGTHGCQQVWEQRLHCPHCEQYIRPATEHLQFPDDATPETIERGGFAYHCPSCGAAWADQDRARAIRAAAWHCIKGAELSRPATVGFFHRAWDCLDIPLAEIATAWHRSQTGDTAARVAWANGYEADDYNPETKEREEDRILLLRDDRPDGIVPTWADAMEISIDTQKYGFWYRIRAWEYGETLTSALVRAGYVESFAALDTLIYQSAWLDATGREHRIMAGIIDSMGSQEGGHTTAQVYDWCRRPGSIILPAKGAKGRKTAPVTVGQIDHYPGTNKPIPGGLRLYHIDTHFHKDELARRLDITPGDPGAFWLHSGYTPGQLTDLARDPATKPPHSLENYAKQMCVEYRDERGLWQCPDKKHNHLWDCESNGLALALYLGFHRRRKDQPSPQQPAPSPPAPGKSGLPSWYLNRR